MQLDYDNDRGVSVSGYAKLWGWSRDKARNFIQRVGAEIVYPENTQKCQNQRGNLKKQIQKQITDRSASEKKQIRFVDSKAFGKSKNRSASEKKQITDRSDDTTKDPSNPNPKNIYPGWLDVVLWSEFKKMRSKIRKPLTDHAEKLRINDLKKLVEEGFSQDELINSAVANCWQNFYPPKKDESQNRPHRSKDETDRYLESL